ncbi:hypothetical protein [Chitinophaga sancti]|uniref:Uncharacterized protein n=1 Tax=Chitinophaga sancti TaxID=1004 RepID=A0A1K1PMQ2_9BACT|nr:hypothetical protein [Chitinophaga sancti]WQD59526.1 hypothetical protein U0033_16660 [Chitinophaga sancti]WQG88339.1 hypothetical protein SR876_25805 [Chitinophaga sancti]SFW48693.1 hypothetical protein SAMN05661012_02107 [Chitinophaga sancti]
MSKSEKRRYLRNAPIPFPLENYTAQLKMIMEKNPSSPAHSFLDELIQRDRSIAYEMIARFVPMETTAEILTFLKAFIAEEKKGDDYISDDGQDAVEKIARSLLERGRESINAKNYLTAAETAFAIILAIEPELCMVLDEGWTYQMILIESFEYLDQIGKLPLSPDVFDLLLQQTIKHFKSIRDEDRYVDDKWKTLMLTFKNGCTH